MAEERRKLPSWHPGGKEGGTSSVAAVCSKLCQLHCGGVRSPQLQIAADVRY